MFSSTLFHWLSNQLIALGPSVLFAACLLETAMFAGLVIPVGALIAFSAMLVARGIMEPGHLVLVALSGAFIGDQLGFFLGRWFIAGARPKAGRIARLWRRALARADALVRRHGLVAISLARATPFVRTIMPWFAGRSGVSWSRFVLFDLIGLLFWGIIYLGGGFLAGQGWRQISGRFGELAGLGALVAALLLFLGVTAELTRRMTRRRSTPNRK